MLTRRTFLVAGGLALAGHLLPLGVRRWGAADAGALLLPSGPSSRSGPPSDVEIALRSAGGGRRVWFDPPAVHLAPGGRIRWILKEDVHTATAFHPDLGELPQAIPPGAEPFDSGYLVEPGERFEVTLEVEGVYDYFCRPHLAAGMVGRIVVAGPEPDPRGMPAAVDWGSVSPKEIGLPGEALEALRQLPSPGDIVGASRR